MTWLIPFFKTIYYLSFKHIYNFLPLFIAANLQLFANKSKYNLQLFAITCIICNKYDWSDTFHLFNLLWFLNPPPHSILFMVRLFEQAWWRISTYLAEVGIEVREVTIAVGPSNGCQRLGGIGILRLFQVAKCLMVTLQTKILFWRQSHDIREDSVEMAPAETCFRRDLTDLGIGCMTLTIGNGRCKRRNVRASKSEWQRRSRKKASIRFQHIS